MMKQLTQYRSLQSGFSIVEIVVSMAILAISMTAILGFIVFFYQSTASVDVRSGAIAYAEAGLEGVRSIRDADYDALLDSTYGLSKSSIWAFAGVSDTNGPYTRQLAISSVGSDTKLVESTVSWSGRFGNPSFTIGTYLTNWQKEIASETFRITEYYIAPEIFTGTNHTLILDQSLSSDYFVIIQGADGDGSGGGNTGPDENYVRLSADPFGTGDLLSSGSSDELLLTRESTVYGWSGVVTVVECLTDCTNSGFELRTVEELSHIGSVETGSDTTVIWDDINQVMLMGGYNGAGCTTVENSSNGHVSCQVNIYPTGTSTIEWQREGNSGQLDSAISTVMVLEWGSEWQVQRVTVSGSNGTNGANTLSAYDTASINQVQRQDTWVWGTGWTNDAGIGDGSEGTLITLGNGVSTTSPASTVAVGQEYSDNREFTVYALSHPQAIVAYAFKPDGNQNDLTYDATMSLSGGSTARMAIVSNGQNGTGNAYPRPMFSARYTGGSTIRLERRRTGQAYPAWIQGVNLSHISPGNGASDITPPAAVTNLSIANSTDTTITLNWSTVGDDGLIGVATVHDVRYSTAPIIDANWGSATQVAAEPTPTYPGTLVSYTISALSAGTTYYVAIRTIDESGNISDISNVVSQGLLDTTAPSAITNLSTNNPAINSVQLSWTSPGDDGTVGTATSYDLRYSTSPITSGNWAAATQASGEPAPLVAGSNQSMTVTGLLSNTLYYFGIRTTDEAGNISALSNIASNQTLSPINSCADYCASLGVYTTGQCRPNSVWCWFTGTSYESGGDQYCSGTGGQNDCCCQ